MNQVSTHKVGLVVGAGLAIWHAIWACLVFLGLAKPMLDWVLGLHSLNFQYNVSPFYFLNALMLVIVTGVFGYLVGCVLGWLWNKAHKQ